MYRERCRTIKRSRATATSGSALTGVTLIKRLLGLHAGTSFLRRVEADVLVVHKAFMLVGVKVRHGLVVAAMPGTGAQVIIGAEERTRGLRGAHRRTSSPKSSSPSGSSSFAELKPSSSALCWLRTPSSPSSSLPAILLPPLKLLFPIQTVA
jgi:hypothetical protein